MTIFDVIKYPISNPPTKDEFKSLPDDLLFAWYQSSGWRGFMPNGYGIDEVVGFYNQNTTSSTYLTALKELSLLRKMIKEYEPL